MFLQLVLTFELLGTKVALEFPMINVAECVQSEFVLTRENLVAL